MKQIPAPQLPARQTGPSALPDPVAIRSCAVPASAPPFDDEDIDTGNGAAADHITSPPVMLKADGPDEPESDRDRAEPPPGWPSHFAQVVAETLAGSRPARQLVPWTTEQARRRLRQLAPTLATDQRPKVRRVMTSAPAAGVLEVTAVVGFGPRLRVLALRLELEQQSAYRARRWCCTTIESA